MKLAIWFGAGIVILFAAALTGWQVLYTPPQINIASTTTTAMTPQKTPEELRAEALDKSKDIRGLYMTAEVANDQGVAATRLRNNIISLAEKTEINGIVIDVKEVCGPEYTDVNIKKLLAELHQKHIWAIARIVTFKDASQVDAHPDWYLHRAVFKATEDQCATKHYLRAKGDGSAQNTFFWRDVKGGYWLDPASDGARNYIVGVGKKVIDLGFDELQFDYVRFPSDGDVEKAIYPAWDGKTAKHLVMKSFFEFLNKNLKAYKPDIILSADLFGYAAIRAGDVGIGQRLDDVGDNFDYISFMVYPSHYYSGLYLPQDPLKKLPPVQLDRKGARMHPDDIVYRSLLMAREFLDGQINPVTLKIATTTNAASTTDIVMARSHVRLRPWLEDFFHEDDRVNHRPYGVEKVKLQIGAAEKVEPHGWLLWNASNVYTEGALQE